MSPRRSRTASWVPLLVAAALLAPLVAPATAVADDVARSKALYKKGENAFAMGDYAHAADWFEQAYNLSQRPQLLWNVAAAHRAWFDLDHDVGHLRRARSVYQNYASLIEVAREREEAQREIARLDEQIAQAERSAPGRAAPLPSAPPPSPKLTPQTAAPAPAQAPAVPAEAISPTGSPSSPPATSTPVWKRWWLWTAVGVVVAGGVATGLVLGLRDGGTPPDGLNAGVLRPTFP